MSKIIWKQIRLPLRSLFIVPEFFNQSFEQIFFFSFWSESTGGSTTGDDEESSDAAMVASNVNVCGNETRKNTLQVWHIFRKIKTQIKQLIGIIQILAIVVIDYYIWVANAFLIKVFVCRTSQCRHWTSPKSSCSCLRQDSECRSVFYSFCHFSH
jgi:hypothetical protein